MISITVDKISEHPPVPRPEIIEHQKRRQLEAVKALRRRLLHTTGPRLAGLLQAPSR